MKRILIASYSPFRGLLVSTISFYLFLIAQASMIVEIILFLNWQLLL